MGVMLNPANRASAHIFDQASPKRAARRTVTAARRDCDKSPDGAQSLSEDAVALAFTRQYGDRLRLDHHIGDRKSVVEGKSVYVRVDRGGRSIIKKNNKIKYH